MISHITHEPDKEIPRNSIFYDTILKIYTFLKSDVIKLVIVLVLPTVAQLL